MKVDYVTLRTRIGRQKVHVLLEVESMNRATIKRLYYFPENSNLSLDLPTRLLTVDQVDTLEEAAVEEWALKGAWEDMADGF